MKRILTYILLVLLAVQPLLAQGLVYRNSELNVMMNEKSDYEKENNSPKTDHIISVTIKSTLIGAGVGGLFVGLILMDEFGADAFSAGFAIGGVLGSGVGLLLGIIIGASTEP